MSRMLGNMPSRAFCHCCNEPFKTKKAARKIEERQWRKDMWCETDSEQPMTPYHHFNTEESA